SESLNNILKNIAQWKQLEVDKFVLAFYLLQSHYMDEFRRAANKCGDHVVKRMFFGKDAAEIMKKFARSTDLVPVGDIIQHVRGTLPLRHTLRASENISRHNPTAKTFGDICFERELYKCV